MKIIKQGKTPLRTKKLTCGYCGCIFEVEQGEYKATSQIAVIHDGLSNYNCECPCCKHEIYFD